MHLSSEMRPNAPSGYMYCDLCGCKPTSGTAGEHVLIAAEGETLSLGVGLAGPLIEEVNVSAHEPLPFIPLGSPHQGELWYHTKSHATYRIIGTGYIEADLKMAVVYVSTTNVLWVRPLSEFMEKFKRA